MHPRPRKHPPQPYRCRLACNHRSRKKRHPGEGGGSASALTLGDQECHMPPMTKTKPKTNPKKTNPKTTSPKKTSPKNTKPRDPVRQICVYCGSSPGTDTAFITAAQTFGQILAENEIGLVYGGGSGGLMGALAAAVLDHGGRVVGIIPEFLKARERMFNGAQEIV